MTKQTLLSVIIPVYNEEANIGRCLKSLFKQSYENFEIIVVDDGSTDTARQVIKQFDRVSLLTQDHQGPGAARNKGAKKAKGEILVFVDADMTFESDFLVKLTQPIRDNTTIGTFSKDEFVANNDNVWAESWSIIRGFAEGRMHPSDYPNQQKVFRAILKSEFDQVEGFDSKRGYDDDWSLSEKLGVQATVAPKAIFYHYNPDSLIEIFHQAYWMGQRKYKGGLVGQFVQFFRSFFPVSLLKAISLGVKHGFWQVVVAQLTVDLAILCGLIFGKNKKA